MAITVVNKSDHKSSWDDIYVGRPSPLGNPYATEDRNFCIEKYKDWLCLEVFKKDGEVIKLLNSIAKKHEEGNVNLVCWCKPLACHADYIKKIIELKTKYRRNKYAGIGSRSTPDEIIGAMFDIARRLYLLGYTLRSGGAIGADKAFEDGHDDACAGFKGKRNKEIFYAKDASEECMEIAGRIHPNWKACNDFARKLHARNVKQILGEDLKSPVDFVLCWTKNGEAQGGTRTAIKIAEENNIPVFNLWNKENLSYV